MTGIHEVDYFTKPEKKVLSFVHPQAQCFDPDARNGSYTALYIGPDFAGT